MGLIHLEQAASRTAKDPFRMFVGNPGARMDPFHSKPDYRLAAVFAARTQSPL